MTTESKFLWIQKQNMGPRPRGGHAAAFEQRLGRVIAFGGELGSGQFLNDTWAWDGRLWTQIADTGPSPRASSSMVATDAATLMLFGGRGDALNGDTWRWTEDSWVQVEDSGPTPRAATALAAYNMAPGQMVLFGGLAESGVSGDTWLWVGDEWVQQENAGPPPRSGHSMVSDGLTGRVLLFGGTGSDETLLGDTWAWDGTSWTQLADMGPSPRSGASMASTGRGMILFGGAGAAADPESDSVPLGDTWLWHDEQWQQIQDMGPPPRWAHSLVFDPGGRLTLFGGFSGDGSSVDPLGDTWERAGDGFPALRGRISIVAVEPREARLTIPGDSLTVTYGVPPIPPPGDTAAVEVDSPSGQRMSSSPALTFPDLIPIAPGSTGGEFLVTLGTNPPEPGQYLLKMLLLSTEGGWGAGIEARHPFEVVSDEPIVEPTPEPVLLKSLAFDEWHALASSGDSLTMRYQLTAPAPADGLTLSARLVDWDGGGVSFPASIAVASGAQEGTFVIARTDEAMDPGEYHIAVSIDGTPGSEQTAMFRIEQ